ncbi:MAG: DNA-3-methyladenine glycosylase I [Acidimicrobiales bacterium]|nr:DNA-3-methyladenine glycosylase I [Acidimicrobiales bacterium]
MLEADTAIGGDGRARCPWGGDPPIYLRYHDTEWGRPEHDDDRLFEKLCLEGFQAGLSWLTILNKRAAFRTAFAGFGIEAVARFGEPDVERLLADAGIVRNRAKIEATIANARAALEVQGADGSIRDLIWRFRPDETPLRRRMGDIPAETAESRALSKELKRRGFRFVGPTTMYALMQAMGLVNDHLVDCWAHAEVQAAQDRSRP